MPESQTPDSVRNQFSLPRDIHYLNNAYMSPLSAAVREAGVRGIMRKARPFEIESEDFFEEVEPVRSLFAQLVHARSPERIAVIPSVSYGIAQVARNTRVERGRNIVIAGGQFPSNVYPWRRVCSDSGAELRVVERPSRAAAADWSSRIVEAIDRQTALVALPQLHWTDGSLFRLKTIGERARDVGAAFVLDGTQSIGARSFDIQELLPDAVICAGYKWLTGPYSVGAAFYGPRYDDGVPIEDAWLSREGSEDFSGLTRYTDRLRAGARRYDVGEVSNFVLIPMFRAALEQVLEWTPGRVQRHALELKEALCQALDGSGVTAPSDTHAAHLFGVQLPPGVDPRTVQEQLSERKVYVSVRGTSVRVSIHLYNDINDIRALAGALRETVRTSH